MNKTIDEIVQTFITDLKRTKEYKEAWRNCNETKDIVFNFRDKKFYNHSDDIKYFPYGPIEIVMDEEILLGR
jgi:hypothetical protein